MHPLAHLALTYFVGLIEPAMVLGEVKITAASGNAAALHYGGQEFVVAQIVSNLSIHSIDLMDRLFQIIQNQPQRLHVDLRLLAHSFQIADMPFKFLEDFRLQVGATENTYDTKQAVNCSPIAPAVGERTKVIHPQKQVLKSKKGANPFIQWMFVVNLVSHKRSVSPSGGLNSRLLCQGLALTANAKRKRMGVCYHFLIVSL